jgi:hypothetical protein
MGNFDMSCVGLGGFVTAKKWMELAYLSSVRMSIKYSNINNCQTKASSTEIGKFQLALQRL